MQGPFFCIKNKKDIHIKRLRKRLQFKGIRFANGKLDFYEVNALN